MQKRNMVQVLTTQQKRNQEIHVHGSKKFEFVQISYPHTPAA